MIKRLIEPKDLAKTRHIHEALNYIGTTPAEGQPLPRWALNKDDFTSGWKDLHSISDFSIWSSLSLVEDSNSWSPSRGPTLAEAAGSWAGTVLGTAKEAEHQIWLIRFLGWLFISKFWQKITKKFYKKYATIKSTKGLVWSSKKVLSQSMVVKKREKEI